MDKKYVLEQLRSLKGSTGWKMLKERAESYNMQAMFSLLKKIDDGKHNDKNYTEVDCQAHIIKGSEDTLSLLNDMIRELEEHEVDMSGEF